jgi:hypothetical protein
MWVPAGDEGLVPGIPYSHQVCLSSYEQSSRTQYSQSSGWVFATGMCFRPKVDDELPAPPSTVPRTKIPPWLVHLAFLNVNVKTCCDGSDLGSGTHLGPVIKLLIPLASEGLFIWAALSDERMDVQFKVAAGPRQRSLSRVRIPG